MRIDYHGKGNYDAILSYLFKNYGKPLDYGDYSYGWAGEKIDIWLTYDTEGSYGAAIFTYKPIDREVLENYKQKVALRKQNQKAQCFIATAIYESPMAIEVIALRAWRDNYLSKYWLGNQFIRIYYKIAPILARHIADKEYLKIFLKKVLDIFIKCLTKSNGSE